MATLNAIARPYAQAAYAFAESNNDLVAWRQCLDQAALIVEEPSLSKALSNSRILPKQWFSLLKDLLSPCLNEARTNFLQLVADNQRVAALAEMAALFKEYEAQNKKETEVQVTTVLPLGAKQEQELVEKLKRSLKTQVNLRSEIDEHILGGAIVRIGDKVIDGSIRGQLKRLLEFAIR